MDHHSIKKVIEEVLDRMTVSYNEVEVGKGVFYGHTRFNIQTEDTGILIGRDGKHLLALGVVVRKMVESQTGQGGEIEPLPFFIDVGGYQTSKIERVCAHAKTMAERARSFRRDVELPPMSSYDRMWVHAALNDEADLNTSSEGEGKYRRVVIKYTAD